MRLLLTGFEPFEGVPVNPTEEIARYFLENPKYSEAEIDAVVLPVIQSAWDNIRGDHLRNDYRAMLHFGAHPSSEEINIERVGLNLDDFRIPDNQGAQIVDQPIHADGEIAYYATLPVKAMAAALEKEGIPAKQSFSAGTYLCNHVMYESLYHVYTNNLKTLSGFIHMPLQKVLGTEDQIRAVKIMLDVIISKITEGI